MVPRNIALPRKHLCIYFLLFPANGSYWYASPCCLAGVDPLHENPSFSVFAKSIGPCKYFFILIPSLNLPYISKCFSGFTLSTSLSLLPVMSSTSALYLPNFSTDISSSRFPPISFNLSRLRYATMCQLALSILSNIPGTALSTLAGNLFFWRVSYFWLPFQLSHVSIRLQ